MPVLDYDIDYLQGRIILAKPLPATADDGLLVHDRSIKGNPVFLVVRYEYTPGLTDPDTLSVVGRAHYWFSDYVKLGLTANRDEEKEEDSNLWGADLTLRKSSETWLRLETGRTKGPGVLTTTSVEGGFDTGTSNSLDDSNGYASAYRVDTSVAFKDIFKNGRGRITFYLKDLEAGYSAPGQATDLDLTQYGGTAELPFTDRARARLKVDIQNQRSGLDTEAGELDLKYRIGENWDLGLGARYDNRDDNSAAPPASQEEGDRTDTVAKLLYDSHGRWQAYGFVQKTIQTSDNRKDNDLSLIHISEPTRRNQSSRMPSSA